MVSIILKKMIDYFNDDRKRINHALKVYGYAKAISAGENVNDREKIIIELTGILHDIGIKTAEQKYNSSAGKYQEIEGPKIAENIMKSEAIDASIIDRVCYLIGHHHSYNKIDGLDFQIIVEADLLVNIEEDALEPAVIAKIKEKHFKTATGTKILENFYQL